MYLRGSKWNMTRRRSRQSSPWRIMLLVSMIGAALYVNQVVVPATPPLFIPTPTPTRNPESFINEANTLFDEGKLTQAIASYQQALLTDPDNPSIYVSMAHAQIYTNEYEAALENAERALLLNNQNPVAYAIKAWALDYLGSYTEAEGAVQLALELDPNNALAHAVHAQVLMDKATVGQGDIGTIERASEASKTALALDPDMLETHRARGYVLWKTGNFAEAIEEYKAALAINDKIANLHLALGHNYRSLPEPDYSLAVQEFLQAYALNPKDPSAVYQISRTYYTIGDFSQSVQYAAQAVQADPADPVMHGNLGVMYYKNNQMQEAVDELSLAVHGGTLQDGTVVEGLPLDYGTMAELYAVYGLALAKSNRCSQAVPIFQAIRTGIPDDEVNVYNAEQGLIICQEGVDATASEEDATDAEGEAVATEETVVEATETTESQP
jgi:tetratricopeptide (TPR) repeat protein